MLARYQIFQYVPYITNYLSEPYNSCYWVGLSLSLSLSLTHTHPALPPQIEGLGVWLRSVEEPRLQVSSGIPAMAQR